MFAKILVFKTLDGQEHHDIDILIAPHHPPFDIHTEIAWGSFKPISDEFIWSNVIKKDDYYIPNKNLDGLVSISHSIFETGKLKEIDIENIKHAEYWVMRREAKKMKWENLFELIYWRKKGNIPLHLLAFGLIYTKQWGKVWGARYILRDRLCKR
jgi:hypothetical protein